jgi:hypothetical protein
VTPQRANEIIEAARTRATVGPWSDQLQHVMTIDERRDLLAMWRRMPGNTCFVDVLTRVANQPQKKAKQ